MIKPLLSLALLWLPVSRVLAEDAQASTGAVQIVVHADPAAATVAPKNLAQDKEDSEQAKLIADGQAALDAGRPQEAITGYFDKVLAYFDTKYGERKERIYCIRTKQETVLYLFTAASEKQSAVVLNDSWAKVHYLKAYALIDMGKIPEAKDSLRKALLLSPWNSKFLSELGHCNQSEKDWAKALDLFTKAEEAAEYYSPDDLKAQELTRALRGQGYALVEMGKLDEAASKYEQCITLSPEDKTARGELAYIRTLRGK